MNVPKTVNQNAFHRAKRLTIAAASKNEIVCIQVARTNFISINTANAVVEQIYVCIRQCACTYFCTQSFSKRSIWHRYALC